MVSATQTGSFVDGLAMVTISKHHERGNLLHAYTSITSPLAYSHFSPLSATLPQKRLLTGEILFANKRGREQIWLHDDYTHLFIHKLYIDTPRSALIHKPWHQ